MPGGARHGSLRRCRSYQASRVPESGILREDETSVRIDGMGRTKPERDISNASLSLTNPARESERRQGFRAVGVPVSKVAAPIIAKRGGGILVRLKAEWAAIVGVEWAAVAWPSALSRDGVLKLRTPATAAVELQHRTPLLIERINLFFGRAVISRLALLQGPLPLPQPPTRPALRPLAPGEVRALDEQLSDVAEPELRDALARLGKAVIGGDR